MHPQRTHPSHGLRCRAVYMILYYCMVASSAYLHTQRIRRPFPYIRYAPGPHTRIYNTSEKRHVEIINNNNTLILLPNAFLFHKYTQDGYSRIYRKKILIVIESLK